MDGSAPSRAPRASRVVAHFLSNFAPQELSAEEVTAIEARCNEEIRAARAVHACVLPASRAAELTASPLFRGKLPPAGKVQVGMSDVGLACSAKALFWLLFLDLENYLHATSRHQWSEASRAATSRRLIWAQDGLRSLEIEGVDINPCGGTHLRRLSDIQLLKVRHRFCCTL